MAALKITLVGGGSYAWTPGVLANLITSPSLAGSHIVLHDIDPDPLELTYPLALKYKDLTSSSITFEKTTDQAPALDGADYVIVTISTGRLKTMKVDLEVPEEFGIFQTVGDTCGPGGLSRALRNIPVFLGMARTMEKRCPDAWMLNVSNPLCAITRAVTKHTSVKALGLCHGILGTARHYARFLGAKLSECAYTNTGIDHCSWFSDFRVRGESAEKLLLDKGIDDWLAKPPAAAKDDPVFGSLYSFRCGLMLWRHLGVLPAIGDRHMAEFFPHFLQGMDNVEKYGLVRTTIADREGYYANARARIERLLSGEEQPELREATDVVGERQSDDLASWITALEGGRPIEDNLNAPNIGQIPELPPGAIVETRGVLDATGFRPIASPLPPQLVPAVLPHVLRDELTVEAAVEGSFEKALAVLTTDPLVGGIETARPMLEKMIALNKDWLPQFSS
jgi:alpha-galactosidase/6-phospho-beta-glucosidase family protein